MSKESNVVVARVRNHRNRLASPSRWRSPDRSHRQRVGVRVTRSAPIMSHLQLRVVPALAGALAVERECSGVSRAPPTLLSPDRASSETALTRLTQRFPPDSALSRVHGAETPSHAPFDFSRRTALTNGGHGSWPIHALFASECSLRVSDRERRCWIPRTGPRTGDSPPS